MVRFADYIYTGVVGYFKTNVGHVIGDIVCICV